MNVESPENTRHGSHFLALGSEDAPRKRKKPAQLTRRSLEEMRKRGFPLVEVVEKWIPHIKRRKDLWGICDVLCVRDMPVQIVAIQVCRRADVSTRMTKISDSDSLPILQRAGVRILVHGWSKNSAGRWVLREEDLS